MPKIKVLSDGACDLPLELLYRYEIEIVPFYISFDGRIVKDSPEITAGGIYEFVDATGVLPGTAACSAGDYLERYKKWRGKGYEVICITMSKNLSSSYRNAKIAAADFDGVYVFDSQNLSSGEGCLAVSTADMAQKGMPAGSIFFKLKSVRDKLKASFVLDTPDYIQRNLKCTSVESSGHAPSSFRQEIVMRGGKMEVGRHFIGSLENALGDYVDQSLSENLPSNTKKIFITHTGCPDAVLKALKRRIAMKANFDEIIESHASGLSICHSGPNALGIFYY